MKLHEQPVIAPAIHMNGDRSDTLVDSLADVYAKLSDARDALRQCGPNGRNYYVGPHSLGDADRQHRERLTAIDELQKSIEREIELIQEQQ